MGMTARKLMVALAICIGVWAAIQARKITGPKVLDSEHRPIRNLRSTRPCRDERFSQLNAPLGYTFIGITELGKDCFATLISNDTSATPGSGEGTADAIGPDGHLLMRFSVVEGPESEWRIVEYLRLRNATHEHTAQ
jgi:hypothetical protein